MSKKRNSEISWFWIILFLLSGTFLAVYGAALSWNGLESLHWPSTEGSIISSKMSFHKIVGENPTQYYKADVTYRYAVNGGDFTSSLVNFKDYWLSESKAKSIIAKYPEGATVKVFYNSNRPRLSVLEPGFDIAGVVKGGIGIFLFIFGLVGISNKLKSRSAI